MRTLLHILDHGGHGDTAITVPGGPRLSYESTRREVARVAETLAGLGLKREDRVGLVFPNGAEAVLLFLGAAAVATAAPLNPNYTEEEFRFYLEDTGARALVVPPGGADAARRAVGTGTILIEASLGADGALQLESSAPPAGGPSGAAPSPDDIALILHTSGTTSRPKRVPLRHRNLAASVDQIAATYALSPTDVSLCVMPLFHVHGLMASVLAALRGGGQVVVPAKFSPLGLRPLIRDHRVTWYSAVPTLHQLALSRGGEERWEGVETLRFVRSCSAALSPAMMALLESRLGAPVLEAYGMTEAAHQIASNPLPPARRRPGSVGVGTGVRIGIMGEGEQLLAPGAVGEVVIQGPNVIEGYESNPQANAESFPNGWFRTGDQGTLDPAGYLSLLGRIKELINRGGEKIAPLEIDEALLQHPLVAEAVSFAMPHAVWGEEVAVAVVLRAPVEEASLIRHCRERLADFKVPRRVFVLDAIPRTATGKVQRRHVAAALLS